MLNNRYRITLGGKSYYPEVQTDPWYTAAWKRVLGRAYGSGARCVRLLSMRARAR